VANTPVSERGEKNSLAGRASRGNVIPRMSKNDEQVLVVRRNFFDELGSFQGLCLRVDDYLPAFLKKENNFFVSRAAAEEDPSLKQIIPYAVFRHGGRILHYTRGAKSGEKRLIAKASIGIGGHVNDTDESLLHFDQSAYHNAVQREIREELRLGGGFTERAVALLNDDSTEVGAVHLGVVHLVELENDRVSAGEKAIAELGFATREELLARRDTFETWSQIVLDGLEILDAS
jgi:predicted NUDIX family phosphoesterase